MSELLSKFYKKTTAERNKIIKELTHQDFQSTTLSEEQGSQLIENYLTNYAVPLGVGLNVQVNHQAYLVPLATEEPSVVAALSNGGKILGNIDATTKERRIIGQIIMKCHPENNLEQMTQQIEKNKDHLLEVANQYCESIRSYGGGPVDIWLKGYPDDLPEFATIYLSFDPVDAMGANQLNTVLEALAPDVSRIIDTEVVMAILSNYQDLALTQAMVEVPIDRLKSNQYSPEQLAQRIEWVSHYAQLDPYRAVTHNKGIMNGITALALATGNDTRAIEAAVHAHASRDGQYRGLSQWNYDAEDGVLKGELTIPMPVATVGGTLSSHPQSQQVLKTLNVTSAKELANVMVSVGLIQNFAALRALVSEGIQAGHMQLQARSTALQVGTLPEELPDMVHLLMQQSEINQRVAAQLLDQIRKNK